MSAQEIIQLRETVSNLEEQLVSLYDQLNGQSIDALHTTIESLEEQLISLYQERQEESGVVFSETVENLEAQVIALTDEKMELERNEGHYLREISSLKNRAREVGAALFEAAIFNSTGKAA